MLRRTLLLSASAFAAGLAVPPLLRAAPAATPETFIMTLTNDALKALNERLTEAEIEKRFQVLLEKDFDLPRIGRFVLGRYWAGATDVEKQEFGRLFEAYVVRSYSLRFSGYSGETVKVLGSRPQSQENTIVASLLVPPEGGPGTKIDWIVNKKGEEFKIIDVNVEGVSMSMTHRQEFATVIERTGGGAEPAFPVGFVIPVVTLEPHDLAVALEGEDMRGDAVEEPAIVRDDRYAAREFQDSFLERAQRVDVEIVGGLVEQDYVGAGFQHFREMDAIALAAG